MSDPRPRVLLAEDDPDLRMLARLRLGRLGFEVLTAADGEEALRIAAAEELDLALLDVTMPGRDGPGVLRALRADPRTASLPVLMLTGHSAAGPDLDGADGRLVKPFDFDVLAARCRELLDRR